MTKTITETSIKNNKALDNLNEKVLELVNDKDTIAPYSASSLVIIFKPENTSQYKSLKGQKIIRMNAFLINTSKTITLHS